MIRRRRKWSLAFSLEVTAIAAGRSDAEMGQLFKCGPRNFANARQGFRPPGHYLHRWPDALRPFRFKWLRTFCVPTTEVKP
jgi:hypothetical protein